MLSLDNLVLRPPLLDDDEVKFLCSLRNNPVLAHKLINRAVPHGKDEVREWLRQKCSNPSLEYIFIVELILADGDSVLAGYATYIIEDRISGVASLGICLAESSRGQGHGAKAVKLMIDYLLNSLGLRKFIFKSLKNNLASRKLFAKLGFREVGIFCDHFLSNQTFYDTVIGELVVKKNGT